MKDIISKIRKDLDKNIDPVYRKNANYGFKEKVKFLGVKIPTVVKLASQYFKDIKNLDKKEIFILCEELWKSGYTEDRLSPAIGHILFINYMNQKILKYLKNG